MGYRRAHATLCEQGWQVNRKRVQRLWREEGLRVPVRRRKRQRLGNSTAQRRRVAPDPVSSRTHYAAISAASLTPRNGASTR
jgi:putative transposase